MSEPLKVDIWFDIACPWCFIGKRRFEAAVEAFSDDVRTVQVEYHSFELSPDTPVDFDGSEVDFLVSHKHLAEDRVAQMLDQVGDLAQEVGLDRDKAIAALKSEGFRPAVNADKEQAVAYGTSGVPFFVIDGK